MWGSSVQGEGATKVGVAGTMSWGQVGAEKVRKVAETRSHRAW